MAKSTTLRLILESITATGADPGESVDRTFELSGYGEISFTHVEVLPAASDQAIALIGDVVGIVILSLNNVTFDLRIDTAERLMQNIRVFAAGFGDDINDEMLATADGSLLVSGDGVAAADLLVVQVKAVA